MSVIVTEQVIPAPAFPLPLDHFQVHFLRKVGMSSREVQSASHTCWNHVLSVSTSKQGKADSSLLISDPTRGCLLGGASPVCSDGLAMLLAQPGTGRLELMGMLKIQKEVSGKAHLWLWLQLTLLCLLPPLPFLLFSCGSKSQERLPLSQFNGALCTGGVLLEVWARRCFMARYNLMKSPTCSW